MQRFPVSICFLPVLIAGPMAAIAPSAFAEEDIAPTTEDDNRVEEAAALTDSVSKFVQLQLAPVDDPRIPANGKSVVELKGQLLDEASRPIRQDALITLTTEAGEFIGEDYDLDQPGFQVVAQEGEFIVQLKSGLESRRVKVRAGIDRNLPDRLPGVEADDAWFRPQRDLQAYTQVEFITELRVPVVTGSINLRLGSDGADYWSSFRDFLDPDADGVAVDLQSSLFATGQIGEWNLTGAYNSARSLNDTCDGLNTLLRNDQLCDERYPVYGDSSTVEYLTPSTDNLYVKLERDSGIEAADPDYLLWGDYRTAELSRSPQLFTAVTRQLHGFKTNYNLGDLQLTGLYSSTVDGFQRDTITPDGTSGYYFLSNRLIIGGSENVFIELEEFDRPGTVLERRRLVRGPDYEIDYDRGTLLFRRPVQATEFDPFGKTLVRRIVATYEFEGDGEETHIYGGRFQYNFSRGLSQQGSEQSSWLGLSYLNTDQGNQDFKLYGVDARVPLGASSHLVAEYAHSENDLLTIGETSGDAYRLEVLGNLGASLQGKAYYRSVTENFANDTTASFTPGQTRYGADLNAQLGSTTSLLLGYDHELNYGVAAAPRTNFFDVFDPGPNPTPGTRVDNSLTTIRAGLQQQLGSADVSLEYVNRDRQDRITDTFDSNASQLVSRLNAPLTDTVTFRAQNELNLSGDDPLYPNRTTLGMDWEAYPGITLRLAHQFFEGGLLDDNSITSLDTIIDYALSDNVSLTSRYAVLGGLNGVTGQGAVGLNSRWAIAKGLHLNAGYEHLFGSVFQGTAAGNQFRQPYAVGQSAASLGLNSGDSYSLGLEYSESKDFQASARWEHRTSSQGTNTVISAAANGRISDALTGLLRYRQASAANGLLSNLGDTREVRLGLAYRDIRRDRWNALMRYEYRQNPATIPDTLLLGSGTGSEDHLLAMEAIFAPESRWEFYGKYGFRHSQSYLSDDFTGQSSIHLLQGRATYQFDYKFDIAAEGRWITQPAASYNEMGMALELGYYPTPDWRIAAGYSFGRADDRDFTGTRSRGGPYLGISMKLNELFNGFGRQDGVLPLKEAQQLIKAKSQPSAEAAEDGAAPTDDS